MMTARGIVLFGRPGVRRAGWLLLMLAVVVWGTALPAAAQFNLERYLDLPVGDSAYGLAVGPDGALYVSQGGVQRASAILVYGPAGDLRRRIEIPPGPTGLIALQGLVFDRNGNLYVADLGDSAPQHGRIVKISPIGRQTVLAAGLSAPSGLAFDRSDILYVTDGLNGSVRWIGLDGATASFVEDERLRPHLRHGLGASGLAFARSGDALFITNSADDRLYRLSIGSDGTAGKLTLFADGANLRGSARGSVTLSGPEGLLVDERGYVLVAASRSDGIEVLGPDGRPLQRIEGSGRDSLANPTGLALNGRIAYVANLASEHGSSHLSRFNLADD